jgi:hypothetical protein
MNLVHAPFRVILIGTKPVTEHGLRQILGDSFVLEWSMGGVPITIRTTVEGVALLSEFHDDRIQVATCGSQPLALEPLRVDRILRHYLEQPYP